MEQHGKTLVKKLITNPPGGPISPLTLNYPQCKAQNDKKKHFPWPNSMKQQELAE